ncbi:MAG: glycoside hydrolase family 71/99-like protein, partial [Chloroflexota bacterium]
MRYVLKVINFMMMVMLVSCNFPGKQVPAAGIPASVSPSAVSTAAEASPAPLISLPYATVTAAPPENTPVINRVDASSMQHKLLMGYQGWFTCAGDGSGTGYLHWFNNDIPEAGSFRVDMYPDMSELTAGERCQTKMKLPDGSPAVLYSAINPLTVKRHFKWMADYGIDGVFIQRFGSELGSQNHYNSRNTVTKNAMASAEAYGRVFAMMYDTSGMDTSTFVSILEKDWKFLVDEMKVTASPSYLHQNGKPVLAIWGLGFTEHPGTPQQAMELINFFENNPDPKYRVTLVGGVPTRWRTLTADSMTDPGWMDYYCGLDVISPWTVGRYSSDLEADIYKLTMIDDMKKASACGAEYMPVVFPGTGFHNSSPSVPFNMTPRRGGRFYWRQIYNAVSIGVPVIYNAMFDEVDEDTAMYKIAATKADQPAGVDLVSMDADGEKLPSDWYLQLAGAASRMLRGEIPPNPVIPISSGAAPLPTRAGSQKLRLEISSSSDWATLTLVSGGIFFDPQLVSSSPEALSIEASGNRFGITQTIARANSGKKAALVLDISISALQAGKPLQFVL